MPAPKKVMLDTNVYDKISLLDEDLIPRIVASGSVIVYGCRVIRQELRAVPRQEKAGSRKLRLVLLSAYDLLVKAHDLPVEEIAESAAREYLKEYSGKKPKKDLYSDFLIVAVASLRQLDIVCTDDNRTMASWDAVSAFRKVNQRNGLRTPEFISYEKFKGLI